METVILCLTDQVVRIDSNAMSSDQTGLERQEIPFRPGCRQHFVRINTDQMENLRQFVHKSDVDVTLGVFDHFGSLRHFDTGNRVGSGLDNRSVQGVDLLSGFGCGAGCHFHDLLHRMFLISRINTLRRISGKEIAVKNQSGGSLQNGDTFIFCYAGADSRFIDHDIASAQDLPYRFTG